MTITEYRMRPLRPESIGTCDWGGCDLPTVAERHTYQHGWLPVCARHALPDADHKRARLLDELYLIAATQRDREVEHAKADQMLLDYIGDEQITAAYEQIERWYA